MQFFTKNLFILLFSFVSFTGFSQFNSLRVQDPRQGFRSAISPIDSAAITIKPKGIYAEVGVYLTYSSKNTPMTSVRDTLEVQHYFSLPKDVMVVDSWLWFKDIIISAKLIDRWTASTIYNNIVGRRSDPSLLLKNGAVDYEFRIFPMAGNETRRVKLTFLIPFRWQGTQPILELPVNLVTISSILPKLNVRVFPHNDWKNPRLIDMPHLKFDNQEDTLGISQGLWADISSIKSTNRLRLTFDSPVKNGVFAAHHSTNYNEGIYQLLFFPNEISNLPTANRKFLVAIDFVSTTTNISTANVLGQIREALRIGLGAKDSFNIMINRLNAPPLSISWIPASKLDSVFNSLGNNPFPTIRDLPTLLAKSIDFLKKNKGQLALFSSDASLMNFNAANELITELKNIANPLPQINIVDFSNSHNQGILIGNMWYVGNSYLYTNLTRQSKGSHYDIGFANDMTEWGTKLFQNANGSFENYDLYTTLEDGYCFGRFNLIENNGQSINRPFLQIGKYKGKMPFKIDFSGTYNNVDISKKITLAESDLKNGDETLTSFWAGQNIFKMEGATNNPDNNIVSQIIDASMSNRVLSRYTAFLALEPALGGDTCHTCDNRNRNTTLVFTQDIIKKDFALSASPNPFTETTQIKITFDAWKGNGKTRLMIYDITGKLIKIFVLSIKEGDTQIEVLWEAQDIPAGVYVVRFISESAHKAIKLVKTE